ncbi:MAG: SAM-dependent methlyltransferase, partial [Gammaproteobacteria bacterium]|nr:SAM-dependent methlyltransferase [Gammaproteobacteria bacterium]
MTSAALVSARAGLLGDTPDRDYSRKLQLFNAYAQSEIRQVIAGLALRPGMRILEAGCGTGEALAWLQEAAGTPGIVMGIDLSAAHVCAARKRATAQIEILQADFMLAPLPLANFDLIWCANTIHHLPDRAQAVSRLAS